MYARVKRTLTNKLKFPKGPTAVDVGFPEGAVKSEIIDRAVYNEFGTTRIPERPFMRNAMRDNRPKYVAAVRAMTPLIIEGKMTLVVALNRLGIMAQTDIKEEISTLTDPPNAPSTIAKKGSSKPLIDTGEMRDAVTWRIKK